jgi:hypothetical protein
LGKRGEAALMRHSSGTRRMKALLLCNAFCAYRGAFSNYGVLDLAYYLLLNFSHVKHKVTTQRSRKIPKNGDFIEISGDNHPSSSS